MKLKELLNLLTDKIVLITTADEYILGVGNTIIKNRADISEKIVLNYTFDEKAGNYDIKTK